MSNEMIAGLVSVVGMVLLGLWRALSKDSKEEQARRLEMVKSGVVVIYHLVEEVARLTPTTIDDKAAYGLGKLNEWLQAQGQPPMTGQEKVLAAMGFTAINGAEQKAATSPN